MQYGHTLEEVVGRSYLLLCLPVQPALDRDGIVSNVNQYIGHMNVVATIWIDAILKCIRDTWAMRQPNHDANLS